MQNLRLNKNSGRMCFVFIFVFITENPTHLFKQIFYKIFKRSKDPILFIKLSRGLIFLDIKRSIVKKSRVFANGPIDRGSIPGRVIPNTQR